MQFEFQSKRLDEILEIVRMQHLHRKGDFPEIALSIVDEVRNKIQRTPIDYLSKLAFQFDLPRLLACIEIIVSDGNNETSEKAAAIARMRPREQMLLNAWLNLVRLYPNPLLEETIRALIEQVGFSPLEDSPKVSNRVTQWLFTSNLPMGILKDYRSTEQSKDLDKYLYEELLTTKHSLFDYVWRTLAIKGTHRDLKRQRPKRILNVIESTQRQLHRMQICQNYLNTLNGLEDYTGSILEYIDKNFGRPNREGEKRPENRFWKEVNKHAKNEFRRWLILREIESFFDGERADFWRDYVNTAQVLDVKEILDGEGFMLDFGNFGVVEFKNVGNAAYIYPEKVFNRFWEGERFMSNHPSAFKDLNKTVRVRSLLGWDGRIIHAHDWKFKTRYRIDSILAKK